MGSKSRNGVLVPEQYQLYSWTQHGHALVPSFSVTIVSEASNGISLKSQAYDICSFLEIHSSSLVSTALQLPVKTPGKLVLKLRHGSDLLSYHCHFTNPVAPCVTGRERGRYLFKVTWEGGSRTKLGSSALDSAPHT